jgi:hypothetical protein
MLINGEVVWFLYRPNLSDAPTTLRIKLGVGFCGNVLKYTTEGWYGNAAKVTTTRTGIE